ncbi:MAG: hypothetical protein AAB434_09235 [Planctomycetota bacterium]
MVCLALACGPSAAEDAALENARAAAEALAAGKGDEAAAHCGKLLTFDLPPAAWVDVHFALLCLRPTDLERLLSRVERKPWMLEKDLSRMPDLVQFVNREPEKAAELLSERLKKAPDDAVLLNLLALSCEGMGRSDEAVEGYERARKAAGKAICFWVNLPQVSLARIRRGEKREDDAYLLEREAITWLTPLPDPREVLAKEGLEGGVRAIRDAAYFRTQLAMALSNVGHYQAHHGQHAAAIDSFRKSLAIEPRDGKTWANLSVSQYDTGDLRGALDSIESAIRVDPENEIYVRERQIIQAKLQDGGK